MYVNEIQIRVRYAETDQMGYVYYGHYATYFEVARVEMLRSLGFSYKILEAEGILLPVLNFLNLSNQSDWMHFYLKPNPLQLIAVLLNFR